MASINSQYRLMRFAEFELDLRSGELLKAGVKMKFGGQPLRVLSILLEHPGELVTREELQRRLWPDTFVDLDHNLNTAINKIREVLGDSAERPRFVETLPRRGYRFIGELAPAVQPAKPAIATKADTRSFPGSFLAGAGVILAIVTGMLIALVGYRRHPISGEKEQSTLAAVPFTALPGSATSPAFSPDGSRIAFTWNGEPPGDAKGYDLYAKALGSETLLRLTRHASEWISPSWSPDGTQIAFHRMDATDSGIYVVPALGGSERKLHTTRIPVSNDAAIDWSPDGKWIAFADVLPPEEHTWIHLLSTETLEAKQIPIDPRCIAESQPAFSHNGLYLAYWCLRRPFDTVLFSLTLRSGQVKAIATFRAFPSGLTWSNDDDRLVYSLRTVSAPSSYELGEVAVASGSTKQIALQGSALLPTIPLRGGKLAYSSLSSRSNIWRKDLLRPQSPDVELIPSSRAQLDAQYSPDGKLIAFASFRSGKQGVWISSSDGTNLVQMSNPDYASGSPQWSPDGSKIVFDAHPGEQWEIYEADVAERNPKKLVTTVNNVVRPSWSRDGRWIYFSSLESGRMGVYRCPASGGDAVLLAKGTVDINAREAFDGSQVYFASNHDNSTLKQVALTSISGPELTVDGLPRIKTAELWALSRSGIFFVPADAPRTVRYFDFANKQIRTLFGVSRDFAYGLSVSRDGRWIMYSLVDAENSDIMLVDHFQ